MSFYYINVETLGKNVNISFFKSEKKNEKANEFLLQMYSEKMFKPSK